MELTVRRGDFLNELALMQGVVERKNTIPILSNILLKASDGHLDLTSTDLDLTLLSSAEARVSRPGSVTVPARKLFDLIRNLPEADVRLKLMENHYLGVTCERSNFRLVAQPAADRASPGRQLPRLRKNPRQGKRQGRHRPADHLPVRDSTRRTLLAGAGARRPTLVREGSPDDRLREPGARRGNRDARHPIR